MQLFRCLETLIDQIDQTEESMAVRQLVRVTEVHRQLEVQKEEEPLLWAVKNQNPKEKENQNPKEKENQNIKTLKNQVDY